MKASIKVITFEFLSKKGDGKNQKKMTNTNEG